MKLLVTGGGGREHAIIKRLGKEHEIFSAPGNGGIAADATIFPEIKATDVDGQAKLAKSLGAELVVIGPDDALALGLSDKLLDAGIPAFGPSQNAARLESSKVFSKDLMKKYNIPTAEYTVFDNANAARSYIETLEKFPTVIKADGLALGKGVIIAEDRAAALSAISEIMEDGKFGDSGNRVVIEEFLSGPEISVFVITDGINTVELSSAMDHKRAGDNDTGSNTGGMGTIAPNPFYTESINKETNERIIKPTITAMRAEGCPFSGVIFFGLMATADGVKVIEYNSRFGDPEAQVILPLLAGDFAELLEKTAHGKLAGYTCGNNDGNYTACVVVASGGYPEKYETGKLISGLNTKGQLDEMPDVMVFHAGTKFQEADGKYYTAGGRVLGITAKAETLKAAIDRAYEAVGKISFEGMQYRKDIGKKALLGNN
ncbi:MAG: phosphoribosylamine--glycine ligase [Ruminococcus sp.]|jgi:phosphoribosylamine--glycine ligase|nr:phosphoribosylamine--glycine ligase [Ruminococcus sp.]